MLFRSEWNKAITDDLTEKKIALKTEKDKTKKKELTQNIAVLEKDLKEKQQLEKDEVALVEKLKKDEAVAANSTSSTTATEDKTTDNTTTAVETNPIPPANINKDFSEQLANVSTTGTAEEQNKEIGRAHV